MSDSKILFFNPTGDGHPQESTISEPMSQAEQNQQFDRLLDLLSVHSSNPTEELAGYLVTQDPTYLPEHPEARTIIRHMGRDQLLRIMISRLLENHAQAPTEDKP